MTVKLVQNSFSGTKSRMETDIDALFDYAVANPGGFTRLDAEVTYGWTTAHFQEVERNLRAALATYAENLICNPDEDNPGGLWIYRLTADVELTHEWHDNRLGDAETRLKTIMNVAQSAMHAHSGRTRTGKRARILYKAASRALEDLEELRQDSA